MNHQDIIDALIEKHDLKDDYYSRVRAHQTSDGFALTLGGMPILPFFVELAERLSIPLENITTDIHWGGGGCDTCGYGGEGSVEIRVKCWNTVDGEAFEPHRYLARV
jgi:hypothetical protein